MANQKIKKLSRFPKISKPLMFGFAAIFALTGGYFVYKSFAAVPYKSATQYMDNTQVIKDIRYTGRTVTIKSNGTITTIDGKRVFSNRLNDGTTQDIGFNLVRSGKAFGKQFRTCVVAKDLNFGGIAGEIRIKGYVAGGDGHKGGGYEYDRRILPSETYTPVCNSWRDLPETPNQTIGMTDLVVSRGVVRVHNARIEWR